MNFRDFCLSKGENNRGNVLKESKWKGEEEKIQGMKADTLSDD